MNKLESWYKLETPLSKKEQAYISLIEESFCIPDKYKKPIPYLMLPHQKEFHRHSLNLKREEAKHILFDKARGISFTTSAVIDLIVSALTFTDQLFPIICHRKETGFEILELAKWLIKYCKLDEVKLNADFTERSWVIRFKHTNSKIQIMPGGNSAEALRSLRLMRGILDEYAFHNNAKALWTAAEGCMAFDIGQWLVASTPNGMGNQYATLVHKARNKEADSFKLLSFPMFDPKLFNPDKSLFEQIDSGLTPLAHWLDLIKIENKRKLDKAVFMQEHMCDFLDESLAYISYSSINKCIVQSLFNVRDLLNENPTYKYTETQNPIYIGIDVAEKNDYFSAAAYEEIYDSEADIFYYIERYLDYFRGKRIPELEIYVNKVIEAFPSVTNVNVDETGLGTGLVGYLKKKWGSLITGINFASTIRIGEGKDTASIRKVMITNIKYMIEDQRVLLLEDDAQRAHINSVDYEFKINCNDGHGDILFANALALLKNKYHINPITKIHTNLETRNKLIDLTKIKAQEETEW